MHRRGTIGAAHHKVAKQQSSKAIYVPLSQSKYLQYAVATRPRSSSSKLSCELLSPCLMSPRPRHPKASKASSLLAKICLGHLGHLGAHPQGGRSPGCAARMDKSFTPAVHSNHMHIRHSQTDNSRQTDRQRREQTEQTKKKNPSSLCPCYKASPTILNSPSFPRPSSCLLSPSPPWCVSLPGNVPRPIS